MIGRLGSCGSRTIGDVEDVGGSLVVVVAQRQRAGLRAIGEVRSLQADIVMGDDRRRQDEARRSIVAGLGLLFRASALAARLRVLTSRLARCGGGVVLRRAHLPRFARLLGECGGGDNEKGQERADAERTPKAVQWLRRQMSGSDLIRTRRDVAKGICRNKGGSEAGEKPGAAAVSFRAPDFRPFADACGDRLAWPRPW